jgi:hypothetical protein
VSAGQLTVIGTRGSPTSGTVYGRVLAAIPALAGADRIFIWDRSADTNPTPVAVKTAFALAGRVSKPGVHLVLLGRALGCRNGRRRPANHQELRRARKNLD